MTRIAVNGFGRIGRLALRRMLADAPELEPVAISSRRGGGAALAHLFRYDSTYGRWPGTVEATEGSLVVDGREIAIVTADRPELCPWDALGVDVVLEATGAFRSRDKAAGHLTAGAARVLVTAPMRDDDVTLVRGVNDDDYDPERHAVVSGGSCTTNSIAPLAMTLDEAFGVTGGLMTTIHAYTRDQELLDGVHTDLRRARSAAENIVPTKTGAAKAVRKVLPGLTDRLVGIALRVPVPTVSLVDLSVGLRRRTTVEALNAVLAEAAAAPRLAGVLGVCDEPLVSSDFRGDPRSCIVDLASTRGGPDNYFKILAWYDNEWAYACRMVELLAHLGARTSILAPAGV